MPWSTHPTAEFDAWFDSLDEIDQKHIVAAVQYLRDEGPMAKMPLSYPIKQNNRCAMRELRPASQKRTEVRILYAFDPKRSAILLLGGDKAGQWDSWYDTNVPVADELFSQHLKAQAKLDAEQAKLKPKQTKKQGRRKR